VGSSFSKELRLLKSVDFDYLRKGASSFNASYFRFYYKNSRLSDLPNGRIGFSISKKVGNACFRNYLKRSLREYYRKSSMQNHNFDVLVIASPRLSKIKNDKHLIQKSIQDTYKNFIEHKLINK
jgi:ribonuclease P protein component